MEISEHEYLNRKRLFQGLNVIHADPSQIKLQKLGAKFKLFRFMFLDDLPLNLVTFDDPMYYFYKCRGNFFHAIYAHLWQMLDHGLVDDQKVGEEVLNFIKYVDGIDFRQRVSSENIAEVNRVLDVVIKYIDRKIED